MTVSITSLSINRDELKTLFPKTYTSDFVWNLGQNLVLDYAFSLEKFFKIVKKIQGIEGVKNLFEQCSDSFVSNQSVRQIAELSLNYLRYKLNDDKQLIDKYQKMYDSMEVKYVFVAYGDRDSPHLASSYSLASFLQSLEGVFIDEEVELLDSIPHMKNLKKLHLVSTTLNPLEKLPAKAIDFLRQNQVKIHSSFIMDSLYELARNVGGPMIEIESFSDNIKKYFPEIWKNNYYWYSYSSVYFSMDEIIDLGNYIKECAKIAEWREQAFAKKVTFTIPNSFATFNDLRNFTKEFQLKHLNQ